MSKVEKNTIDICRQERTNIPEVVLARFKDDDSLIDAVNKLLPNGRVLITKCKDSQYEVIEREFGDKIERMDKISGTVVISDTGELPEIIGSVAIISAGSSDYFVAEEASISAEYLGLKVFRHYDCGVAGIHRINKALEVIRKERVDVVIVIAGMEGALPSIVAGLVKQPIIAVPTSVGYGTSFHGLSALLSMLNTCSPGIAVMNIDNGFGAAVFAYKAIKWMQQKE